MVEPLSNISSTYQPSTILEKLPIKSNLQYGISSLRELSLPKKSFIALIFMALGACIWILWKKRFSVQDSKTPVLVIPKEIQEWVEQNCKDLDEEHQHQVSHLIYEIKNKPDEGTELNAETLIKKLMVSMALSKHADKICTECGKAKEAVKKYFKETNPALQPITPSIVKATDSEILTWINRRPGDLSEEQKQEIVRKVHDIESHPHFLINPKTYILSLRGCTREILETKALAYLTSRHNVMRKK